MLRFAPQFAYVAMIGVLLALVSAACGGGSDDGTTSESGDRFPVALERSDGQTLTIESPPQRMVVLSPGHVEILFAIGAGDQVVAVDQNSDFPPEAAAIEPKLSGFEPSLEAIAAVDPDLVIVSFDADGIVGALDGLGIPVFLDDIDSRITTIEGVFESIVELGRATGHTAEAEELVAQLEARVDAVVEAVADVEQGPRIYHEQDTYQGFNTAGLESFVGDLYNKLKARNIALADEGAYPTLQSEAIIERNPEVILLADAAFGETPEVVAARPGWDTIDAVANDWVYAVDPDIFSRPGPRIVDALEELARLLYPGLFPDEEAYRCWVCSAASA